MERKTKVHAEDGKHDLLITRQFDLPVELLFRAYVDAEIVEQWMGTKVLKLDSKRFGSWEFETTDPKGNKFRFYGVIHDFIPDNKITRTFEMQGSSFGVQLEFLSFEKLTDETSKLTVHSIFESGTHRDEMLKLPFAYGLNMAHNRLQEICTKISSDTSTK